MSELPNNSALRPNGGRATPLYVGEPKRCEDCGEYVFFNHHMWSSGPDGGRTTHGNCESAAEAIRELPLTFDIAMSAITQTSQLLGSFICGTDDDEYADPKRLQRLLHDAYAVVSEGVRAESIRRESSRA